MQPSEPGNSKVGVGQRWVAGSLGFIALILVAFCVYGPTLRYEMIFDDHLSITLNKSVQSLTPLFGTSEEYGPLKPKPGTPVEARPLVSLTFALNYYFGQLDPWGYRLAHVVAHILVALLIWVAVSATLRQPVFKDRFLTNSHWLAFWAAMIWMVHPTHNETVVYLTQRTELQMGLFYALTIYLSIRFWQSTRLGAKLAWCSAAIAASVCGMLSKEMMASVPAMVFFYEWTFVGGSVATILRRSWMLYVGLMLSWLPLIAIYSSGAGTPLGGFNNTISAHDFWLTQSNSFFVYWRLLFCPWPLLLHYDVRTLTTISEAWPGVFGISLYFLVTAFCVWRRTALGFVLLWFFAVLSPTLIVPLPHEEISERRLYVPLMGIIPYLSIGAILLVQSLFRRFASKQDSSNPLGGPQPETTMGFALAQAPLLALTIALVLLSMFTLPRLKSQSGLWLHVLKHQPHNTFAIASQGIEECTRGEFESGLQKIQSAYDTDPKYEYFNTALVQTLDYMREYERLLATCRQLNDLFPHDYRRVHALAVALEKNGMRAEAISKYREAIELIPDSWQSHSSLATLLAESNQNDEAVKHFEIATEIHPDYMNCVNLMTLYLQQQRKEDALRVGKLLLEAARKEMSAEEVAQVERTLQELEGQIKSPVNR